MQPYFIAITFLQPTAGCLAGDTEEWTSVSQSVGLSADVLL